MSIDELKAEIGQDALPFICDYPPIIQYRGIQDFVCIEEWFWYKDGVQGDVEDPEEDLLVFQ
jgi:hypothetical protein